MNRSPVKDLMVIKLIINIVQIVSSLLLIASILLQSRGTGIGSAFGGGGAVYQTRRGIEKGLFFATIILAIVFFTISFVGILIK